MLNLVKLKIPFDENIELEISKLGGKIDYVSELLPSLVFIDNVDRTSLAKLEYVEKVEVDCMGYLQAIEVRPSINFSQIWSFSNYKDIRVAVVDSGICKDMISKLNVVKEIDFSGTSLTQNNYLHGTGVADIINQVVPGVQILNAKITDTNIVKESDVIKALEWAYINNAKIINLSLGFVRRCKGECFLCSLVEELTKKGVLIVAAAGNEGPAFGTINCPGNSSSAITVGAVYLDGKKLADISSRGRYGQSKPDLVTSGYIYVKDTKDIQYGTSFAAPIITGVAASIFDLYKEPNLVKSIIMNATDNIGYPYHEQGKGMFNIKKLVEVLSVGETNYRN